MHDSPGSPLTSNLTCSNSLPASVTSNTSWMRSLSVSRDFHSSLLTPLPARFWTSCSGSSFIPLLILLSRLLMLHTGMQSTESQRLSNIPPCRYAATPAGKMFMALPPVPAGKKLCMVPARCNQLAAWAQAGLVTQPRKRKNRKDNATHVVTQRSCCCRCRDAASAQLLVPVL